MNIGFDAKRLFLNSTGLGNYSRDLVSELIRQFPDEHYHLYTPKERINEKTKHFFSSKNISIHLPKGINKFFASYWRSINLEKHLHHDNINIYHGLSNEIPLIKPQSKIKYVVSIHDLIFLHFPELYKPIDRNIYDRKFRYAAQNSDVVIAISEQTKSDILNFYNIDESKVKVIYQSCHKQFTNSYTQQEIDEVKSKYNLPKNYLLNVGTIEKRKNLEVIVKAIKYKDIPLVVVGKTTNYFRKIIQPLISKYGLENKIFIRQDVHFIDLPKIYSGAEMLIYPSLYEGFGIPILEALYSKIPVITSNTSSLPEVGGKDSIYVNPNSEDELSEKIDFLLSNKDVCNEMVKKGYDYAKYFTNDAHAKSVYNIYKQLS